MSVSATSTAAVSWREYTRPERVSGVLDHEFVLPLRGIPVDGLDVKRLSHVLQPRELTAEERAQFEEITRRVREHHLMAYAEDRKALQEEIASNSSLRAELQAKRDEPAIDQDELIDSYIARLDRHLAQLAQHLSDLDRQYGPDGIYRKDINAGAVGRSIANPAQLNELADA